MVKKKISKKEENAEGCCFKCKDGGLMRLCDFRDCPKVYHPHCVEEDDSFLETDCHWTCCYHYCFRCGKSSKFRCFCCPIAVCGRCLSFGEFAVVRGNKGLCKHCSILAFLIEENVDRDSNGEKIDFNDRETYECFFLDYYGVIKEKEGLNSLDVRSAYNFHMNAEKKCDMDQHEIGVGEDDTEESEDESDFIGDDLDDTAGVKSTSRKKRCMKKPESVKGKVKNKLSKNVDGNLSPDCSSRKDKLQKHDLPELLIGETCNSNEQYSEHFAQCLDKRKDVVGPKTPIRKNQDATAFDASVEQLSAHSASQDKGTSQDDHKDTTLGSIVTLGSKDTTISEELNSNQTFHPAKCNTEFSSGADGRNLSANRNATLTNDVIVLSDSGSGVDGRNLSANRNATLTNDVIVLSDSDEEDTNVQDASTGIKEASAGIKEAENPDISMWHCLGPLGGRRGPFSMFVLKKWSESACSPEYFKVWRIDQSETDAIPLTDALKQVFPQYVGKSK